MHPKQVRDLEHTSMDCPLKTLKALLNPYLHRLKRLRLARGVGKS